MRISINATFDEATEKAILNFKRDVKTSSNVPIKLSYRPHITLAAYETETTEFHERQLVALANEFKHFPVQLDVIGIFPENGVVFLAPRMTEVLFQLHRATLDAMKIEIGLTFFLLFYCLTNGFRM